MLILLQPNAREMARREAEELAARAEAEFQAAEEEEQKREQRGKEALARERLNRRYIELMEKLQQAQQDHQLSSYMKGADLTVCSSEGDVHFHNSVQISRDKHTDTTKYMFIYFLISLSYLMTTPLTHWSQF